MYSCPSCLGEFPSEFKFTRHIQSIHKKTQEEYYQEVFPRFDLFTEESIEFKSKEFYLSNLFNNRINMVKYLRKFPEKAATTIKEIIKLRSELKGLSRMLSTVEARSCIYPTVLLCKSLNIDWCEIGKELGLSCLFNYKLDSLEFYPGKNLKVLIDTREQLPFSLKCQTTKVALKFADYNSPTHSPSLFVERKSLNDFISTLSGGYERFQREMKRAKDAGTSLVVLVENDLNDVISGHYKIVNSKIKATPEFILHRMREIINDFKDVQFLFVKNRAEAERVLPQLFLCKTPAIDWQWAYDASLL